MSRPTKYKPEYTDQALNLTLLGLKDSEIASVFGVSEATLTNWKKQYPEFLASLKQGKDDADGKVARKLYHQALEGNTTAMIFWLKNRQPKYWRDRPEPEEQESAVNPVRVEVAVVDARTDPATS